LEEVVMRNPTRFLRVTSGLGMCLAGSALASHAFAAQPKNTATPPLPNVMLLMDTSGSMEQMIDGSDPEKNADVGHCLTVNSACTMDSGTSTGIASCPNRWGTVLQSMTGNFSQGYRCYKDDRSSAIFKNEYTVNGSPPYDVGYSVPYHRPVFYDNSKYCMMGPWKLSNKGGTGTGVGAGGFGVIPQSPAKNEPDEFANDALAMFEVSQISAQANKLGGGSCTFDLTSLPQYQDGIIDSARDLVRFGLMTFDTDTDGGTSVGTVTPLVYNPTNFFKGLFSYYPQWDGSVWDPLSKCPFATPLGAYGPCQGNPVACSTLADFEVGARNPAAPMWEGRMVQFPDPASSLTDVENTNDAIQRVLLASRPYGATPIQGMLWDARNYFFYDPNGPVKSDPYTFDGTNVGCRDQYIILMTDGTPNLDLEPSCATAGAPAGKCPFTVSANTDRSEQIVADLAKGGPTTNLPQVTTFVIGFAMGDLSSPDINGPAPSGRNGLSGALTTCDALVIAGTPPTWASSADVACGIGGPAPKQGSQLEACCMLQKVAIAGTPPSTAGRGAFFVETGADMGKAFSTILGGITAKTSSKTVPSLTPVLGPLLSNIAVSSQFLASFDTTNPSAAKTAAWPWSGTVQRIRTTCAGAPKTATDQPIDPNGGDDFRNNLASGGTRYFLTVQDQTTPPDPMATLRQYIPSDIDGAGPRLGHEIGTDLTTIVSAITPASMGITAACGQFRDTTGAYFGAISQTDCQKAVLSFTMGLNFAPTPLTPFPYNSYNFDTHFSRAPSNPNGFSALGAILHSNPVIVPAPSAQARDDSYRLFATRNFNRPQMLYVATIDGLLHAFDATSEPGTTYTTTTTALDHLATLRNNEMWAFIPPAVLPTLASNYPGGGATLLDGSPVVKDVVLDRTNLQTTDSTRWHTVLVAGMGGTGRGYYALDVTDPQVASHWVAKTSTLPGSPADSPVQPVSTTPSSGYGPHFLWQMAKVPLGANDVELFGKHAATPALATLAINDSGGVVHEVGVAILPGGQDDGPFGICDRASHLAGSGAPITGANPDAIPLTNWNVRTRVRQWHPTDPLGGVSGRSVTIVRLDNGQIIRTFGRYTGTAGQNDIPTAIHLKNLDTNTPLDSPMTGTPVVYPAQTGAIATKFFIGDADGTIWKFDVSSNDPAQWGAQMFFDAFATPVWGSVSPPGGANRGTKPNSVDDYASASQPIALAPVTSLDAQGNLVLHIATGDQDTFASTVFVPGKDDDKDDVLAAYNFMYSITEKLDTSSPPTLRANVNWFLPFGDGERVTGPMSVFDSKVYFATFAPSASSACGAGEGRIWGLDFVTVATGCAVNPQSVGCGGVPMMTPLTGTTPVQYIVPGGSAAGQDPGLLGHVITGVGVRAKPPCADTTALPDPLAGGSYAGLGQLQAASYSLVASVSTKATAKNDVKQVGASYAAGLAAPKLNTRIDAWAAIVE
jgi:type IV pilus assembly protein PilY1